MASFGFWLLSGAQPLGCRNIWIDWALVLSLEREKFVSLCSLKAALPTRGSIAPDLYDFAFRSFAISVFQRFSISAFCSHWGTASLGSVVAGMYVGLCSTVGPLLTSPNRSLRLGP